MATSSTSTNSRPRFQKFSVILSCVTGNRGSAYIRKKNSTVSPITNQPGPRIWTICILLGGALRTEMALTLCLNKKPLMKLGILTKARKPATEETDKRNYIVK